MLLQQSLEITLKSLDDLPWDHQVFVKDFSLSDLSEAVLILDDDSEIDRDAEDEPVFASSQGFKSYLSISELQGIKENLVNSKNGFSTKKLVKAILYYHKYDAFIE
ncbi:hypothetical protein KUL152_08290 [Tenacibaculum sp. KUL152]|nr:hypothetical protein KUL152_08290 [Tenacibaculum sp. KUL152]